MRRAIDARSSARSIARMRSVAAVSPKPRSITTGPSSSTRMFAARSARWAKPTSCSSCTSRQTASEQLVGHLRLVHLVEAAPVDPLHGQDHGLVRQRRHGRDPGQADTAPPGQHHEERLVGHVVVQVLRRPRVGRASEQRGPVGAVQDVRVTAVTAVHLEERGGALDRVGVVQLGPAAVGAAQLEAIELQPGARQPRRHRRGGGAPVGRTEDDEDGRADHRAGRRRQRQLGGAGRAGDRHHREQGEHVHVGRPPPRSRQPRLADHGGGGHPGEVGQRGEPGRSRPRCRRSGRRPVAPGDRPRGRAGARTARPRPRRGRAARCAGSVASPRAPATTTTGPTSAAIWVRTSRSSRAESAARPDRRDRSSVTPSAVEVPVPRRMASASVTEPHTTRRTTSPG